MSNKGMIDKLIMDCNIKLDPNEIVTALRALFWEEEKWNNVLYTCRQEEELMKVINLRKKLSDHLCDIAFIKLED
jgi:hypothetical protein